MMTEQQHWPDWLQSLQLQLVEQRHRACVILVGDAEWRQSQLQQALATSPENTGIEISEQAQFAQTEAITSGQLSHRLGQETDFAIFTAEAGIDANALGQASGMIRAGGILWLSLPSDWCEQPNPSNQRFLSYPLELQHSLKGFNRFFWQGLKQQAEHHQVYWVEQNKPLPKLAINVTQVEKFNAVSGIQLTADQTQGWQAIQSVAFGHRHRPLVITADRGRGKSTLLGVAAIRLLQEGKQTLAITAARRDQAQAAFDAAIQTLNHLTAEYSDTIQNIENLPGWVCFDLQIQRGQQILTERKTLKFIAPDACLAEGIDTDVLMIDEAAHLPMPMLMNLTESHNRVIFATTQQGYEGSGRGFSLRFLSALKSRFADSKTVQLHQPIRWAENDPLENTLNACLLFATDSTENQDNNATVDTHSLNYRPISVEELVNNRTLLTQLFQLLTFAHYQTAPNDLMQLLETPNQQLWVAEHQDKVLGVLFALEEGGLPADHEGRKQGHLFPQQMQRQTANKDWLTDKTLRIVRLAVQPDYQSQGIGSQLLTVFTQANTADFAGITTSFGATPSLVDFWHRNGFTALHLGQKRDKASGTHSLLMALPFSHELTSRVTAQHATFIEQFAWLLSDSFQILPVELVLSVLVKASLPKADFPQGYLTNQPFEAVSYQLRQWTISHADDLQKMEIDICQLWVQRILQNHSWESLLKTSGMTSRKQLEKQFKLKLIEVSSMTTIAELINEWIDKTNIHYQSKRVSCRQFTKDFDGFYPESFLANAYYVVLDDIPKPDFPILKEKGFGAFFDMDLDGITYKNTYYIKSSFEKTLKLHFHELVHVAQWKYLGDIGFIQKYLNELSVYGYDKAPLEKMAYGFEQAFVDNNEKTNIPAYVENSIKKALS